jgi:hypothetical protein
MTIVMRTPNGDLDLGGAFEFSSAMAEIARVAGNEEYPSLYGLAHADKERLASSYWTSAKSGPAFI